MATVEQIYDVARGVIVDATQLAIDQIALSDSHTADSIAQAESERLASLSIAIVPPTLPEVPLLDTSQDFDALYVTRRDQIWGTLEQWLQDTMNGWMEEYAPKLDAQIQPLSDQWIIDALGGQGLGIPAGVLAQIWDRGRARELQEGVRLEQEAIDGYAARGFARPPGALAAAMQAVQESTTVKGATFNREVAIKESEIKIDISKLGMQFAVQLRLGVAQALAQFLQAALAVPALAMNDAKTVVDAKAVLQQMVTSYIQGKVAVADIEWRWKDKQASVDLGTAQILSQDKLARSQQIINASIAAANKAMGIAAAAINSQQTLSGVTYSGQQTEST